MGSVLTNLPVSIFLSRNENSFSDLSGTGMRQIRDILFPCVTELPYIKVVSVLGNVENMILGIALVHGLIIAAGLSLVYSDTNEKNRALLRYTSRCVKKLELSSVNRKKWHVREQSRGTNDNLPWLLLGYYSEILEGIMPSTGASAETKSYDAGYMSEDTCHFGCTLGIT